jgi:hypothetical protein
MDTPAVVVNVLLTLLFVPLAAHGLQHGVGSPEVGRRERVDHLLHAAMALSMAAMPWSTGRLLPHEATVALFVVAALWFLVTAVSRRSAHRAHTLVQRLTYAAGMAAMAWTMLMQHGGGDSVHVHLARPTSEAAATAVLALYLLACALRSLTFPMPTLRSAADSARCDAAMAPFGYFRDGVMALGAAVMLLMP